MAWEAPGTLYNPSSRPIWLTVLPWTITERLANSLHVPTAKRTAFRRKADTVIGVSRSLFERFFVPKGNGRQEYAT